jgi:two-component system NtrC family response regulator
MMEILIVEDEQQQRELVKSIIEQNSDHQCQLAESAEAAIRLLEQRRFDLVLSDWKLNGADGLYLLEQVKINYPHTSFVLMTAYGSISHAVASMRSGADDYLAKPFEKEPLLFALAKLENARLLTEENKQLKQQVVVRESLGNIIGGSAKMQTLYQQIDKVSNTDITVLIHGESGTGKELVAQALHKRSERADKKYLVVNCSAIPETLAETELFGAEKGAYTGASQQKIGKIEAADGGTLFLDEVAELPASIQAKLLRFLQEGTIMRVGSTEEIAVDVRVIAASHKSLSDEVDGGRFREDLFYRLNIIPLSVPPLRDRLDDLPELLDHFCLKYAKRHQRKPLVFSKSAMQSLYQHTWPGNIRELGNLIERLSVMNDNQPVTEQDLPFNQTVKSSELLVELPAGGINWDDYEKSILQQALKQSRNNKSKAAKLLGLNYKAFLYRLDKHQISSSD